MSVISVRGLCQQSKVSVRLSSATVNKDVLVTHRLCLQICHCCLITHGYAFRYANVVRYRTTTPSGMPLLSDNARLCLQHQEPLTLECRWSSFKHKQPLMKGSKYGFVVL